MKDKTLIELKLFHSEDKTHFYFLGLRGIYFNIGGMARKFCCLSFPVSLNLVSGPP